MRKAWLALLVIVLLMCTGCSGSDKNTSEEKERQAEKISEITIPETYLNFTDQNTEELS